MPNPKFPQNLPLPTLHTKPSWHNRTGRPDRSACAVLNATDIDYQAHYQPTPHYYRNARCPTPPPPNPKKPIAVGTATVDAYTLLHTIRWELPHQLQGDLRTKKANALKSRYDPIPGEPTANPNRGATRTKILGLPACTLPHPHGWQQTITVHRVHLHTTLKMSYILCPRCKKRARKLFLPLCTEQEYLDARLAHAAINMFRARHPNAPGTQEEADLIKRYSALFPPRSLLCKQCLNLRYGEAKPTAPVAS